jgi:chemotaxis protein histidine kinase CheA
VGLAAVKRRVQEVGGEVTVESEPGFATRFTLTMPTSLSAQKTLIVAASRDGDEDLLVGIPSALVQAVGFRRTREDGSSSAGEENRALGQPQGTHSLSQIMLGCEEVSSDRELLTVTVGDGVRSVVLAVGKIMTESEVVVEPLPPLAQFSPLVAGASLVPPDRIMLILNVPALLTAQEPAVSWAIGSLR